MRVRKAIEVSGIVQGVGFRPYVYRLATAQGLAGRIANTSAGVAIEVQGEDGPVEEFLARLPAEAPPLARITRMVVREQSCNGDTGFHILSSETSAVPTALISPDVAVCPDCLRELFDPSDRRHRYPFINCTNCGPRFTIVRGIPYDRPRTSMAVFAMCPACQAEYDNPADRRFHAQPNACLECGPHVELWDSHGKSLAVADPVKETAAHLCAGNVGAVKGLGGFHLAADATNAEAVQRLRLAKRRVEKPFAVMMPDLDAIARACELDEHARATLTSPQRPIMLLPKAPHCPIADAVAPQNRYLGVFLPYTPLHYLLFAAGRFSALVMTSGNLGEEPIAIENHEAVERLRGLADFFLVHNRDILLRCDDSVVRFAGGRLRQLRRSRGYVPVPVFLAKPLPPILAVGGELKNTVCLTKENQAFLSQHVGDLQNLEGYRFFEEAIAHLQGILAIHPKVIACDLHPGYFSTQWARTRTGARLVGVQHHHAHIAACIAENQVEGRVIGIALDGTGYGLDRAVWGGEVLVADAAAFQRLAHFEYVAMPGGEAAIREPWRMAVSYLAHSFGDEMWSLPIPLVHELDRSQVQVLLRIIRRGVNSPPTSSCGRLFDAVAALLGLRSKVTFEGQAAMELEMIAEPDETAAYPFHLLKKESGWRIGVRPLLTALIGDLRSGVPTGVVSARFHNGLVEVFRRLAVLIRERTGLNLVCLSGGCFQNTILLERLSARLQAEGFRVFTHAEVPCNDGGLSLGQAWVAAHRLGRHENGSVSRVREACLE